LLYNPLFPDVVICFQHVRPGHPVVLVLMIF